jgi:hypothetical protein
MTPRGQRGIGRDYYRVYCVAKVNRWTYPYSFDTVSDPAFWAEYRSGSIPDPDEIQGFDVANWKKFTAGKKIKFLFLNKNYNIPIPRPP